MCILMVLACQFKSQLELAMCKLLLLTLIKIYINVNNHQCKQHNEFEIYCVLVSLYFLRYLEQNHCFLKSVMCCIYWIVHGQNRSAIFRLPKYFCIFQISPSCGIVLRSSQYVVHSIFFLPQSKILSRFFILSFKCWDSQRESATVTYVTQEKMPGGIESRDWSS